MLCHYWCFEDFKFKFKLNICNECSIRCIFSKTKRIEILNVKGIDYRCVLCGIGRNKAVNILNNSVLKDRGVIILNTSVLEDKVFYKWILVQTFGGTYFRDVYSGVNGKWYRKSWKEFDQLKDIDQKCYCSSYYDASVNKYGVKCGTPLIFWQSQSWIIEIGPYGWFQCFFFLTRFRTIIYITSKRNLVKSKRKIF